MGIDVPNGITDKILARLIAIRDGGKSLPQELIPILEQAYENNATWNHIKNSVKELSLLFDENTLFQSINPQTITQELMKIGINKKDASYYQEWWHVTKESVKLYVNNILTAYTLSDVGKEDHKYKLFDRNPTGIIEPTIFFVVVNKKSNTISYQYYDPDDRYYEQNIKKVLENNFLFSIRDDV